MLFRKEESDAKPRKFKRKRDGCRFDAGDAPKNIDYRSQ